MANSCNHNGFALISIVCLTAVLAVIAVGIIEVTRTQSAITENDEQVAMAWAAMEGALLFAVARLVTDAPDPARFPLILEQQIGAARASITITAESAKLDLNSASVDTLQAFFEHVNVPETNARRLAAAIVDWRDEDRVAEYFGAEASAYLLDGSGVFPRNGLFESLGEIRWVRGMSAELYECIKPFVTVYGQSAQLDLDRIFGAVMEASDRKPGSASITVPERSLAGEAFTIDMQVRQEHSVANYRAVIRITGDRTDPFWLLALSQNAASSPHCLTFRRSQALATHPLTSPS